MTSPALPVPPPRVCTVSSSNDASSTDASSTYRRALTASSPSRRPRPLRSGCRRSGGDRHLLQEVELVEDLPRAERHARERVVTHRDRQIRLLTEQEVETPQQRAASGQHDALVDDVRGQLGRSPLET